VLNEVNTGEQVTAVFQLGLRSTQPNRNLSIFSDKVRGLLSPVKDWDIRTILFISWKQIWINNLFIINRKHNQ